MTGLEEFLLTLIGILFYFLIGIGSHKIQVKAGIKSITIVEVVMWPLDLCFAAFLVK